MPVHNRIQVRSAAVGGVIAGAAGGLALIVFTVLTRLIGGQDVWAGMKSPSSWLLGERALQPGFDFVPLYVGLGTHFAVSIAWGVAFALLFYGLSRLATIFAGLGWGIVVWLTMFYLVLPVVGLGDAARSVPIAFAIIQHLLFGVTVAAGFLPFQHELPRGVLKGDQARPV
jgi:hypothetical protein